MNKNVTLSLEETVLIKAKHIAVEQRTSLSQLVASLIQGLVNQNSDREKAKELALKHLKKGFYTGKKTLSREELYAQPRNIR